MTARDDIAAAIDIGSNTVHMLVGRHSDGRLEWVDEASELVGLAEDVYAGGSISSARIATAAKAVATLAQRAREHGAGDVLLVATAAVRDAANADDLAASVHGRSGLNLRAISGDQEAMLTYRGAAAGEDALSLEVCDVGGGSTEVIQAERGRVIFHTSLPVGSSRLSRSLIADPPGPGEIAQIVDEAGAILSALPGWQPERLIVTGGTATALARVAGSAERRCELSVESLARIRATLGALSSAEVAAAHQIEPKRARLLPAGAAIIAVLCAAAGVARVVLSGAGLRDGLLIEHFEGGL